MMWRRREFITLIGGAVTWPLVARGQQRALPVIGWLTVGSPDETWPGRLAQFKKGLAEGGFLEGRDVAIEHSWAEGRYDRLAGLAADLVRRRVAVICTGPAPAAIAAKAATGPIVFNMGADPVALGLVASLSRPGGNLTGEAHLTLTLQTKRLELLRELVPKAGPLGCLLLPMCVPSRHADKTPNPQWGSAAAVIRPPRPLMAQPVERGPSSP